MTKEDESLVSPPGSPQEDAAGPLRLIRCFVAGINYCIDMAWVRTILRAENVEELTDPAAAGPGETGAFGRIPGDDEDILVYALGEVLGIPGGRSGQVLVAQEAGEPWGLMVDSLSRVVVVDSDRVHPVPKVCGAEARRLFRGVVMFDDGPSLYLRPAEVRSAAPVDAHPPFGRTLEGEDPQPSPRAMEGATPRASAETARGGAGSLFLFSSERSILFGLSLTQVTEILDQAPVFRLPKAPSYVLGLIAWRDRPVPVVDLGRRLGGRPATLSEATRVIISRSSTGEYLGLPARRDLRILDLPFEYGPCDEDLSLDPTLVRGAFEIHGQTLVVPDLDAVVDPFEPARASTQQTSEEI